KRTATSSEMQGYVDALLQKREEDVMMAFVTSQEYFGRTGSGALTGEQTFVARAISDLGATDDLEAAKDDATVAPTVGSLEQGNTRLQAIRMLEDSQAVRGAIIATQLYDGYLKRPPDLAGLNSHVAPPSQT